MNFMQNILLRNNIANSLRDKDKVTETSM